MNILIGCVGGFTINFGGFILFDGWFRFDDELSVGSSVLGVAWLDPLQDVHNGFILIIN